MWSTTGNTKKKKIRANFTLDEDVFAMFKRQCDKRMITMSKYINKQMKNFVGL